MVKFQPCAIYDVRDLHPEQLLCSACGRDAHILTHKIRIYLDALGEHLTQSLKFLDYKEGFVMRRENESLYHMKCCMTSF